MNRRALGVAVAATVAVTMCAWWVRTAPATPRWGRDLRPRPDALHYVAGAQSIDQRGSFVLRTARGLGQPRYAPGWSILLAGGLRAGISPRELWRLAAAYDVANLMLLAILAGLCTRVRLGWPVAAAAALLLVALPLALSPERIRSSRVVLSEPAALFWCLLALVASASAVRELDGTVRRRALLAIGGFAGAWAIALRPLEGVLAALSMILVLLLAPGRPPRRILGTSGWALVGALPVIVLTSWIVGNSGRAFWGWVGYLPQQVGGTRSTLQFVHPTYAVRVSEGVIGAVEEPGLRFAARVLAGGRSFAPQRRLLPGLPMMLAALVGWAAARGAQGSRQGPARLAWVLRALAIWAVLDVAVYSAYFYRQVRFFYAPSAVLCFAGAIGVASLWSLGGWRRALGSLLAGWVVVASGVNFVAARSAPELKDDPGPSYGRVARAVAGWRQHGIEDRVGRSVDLVAAQAFGLMSLDELDRYADDLKARAARLDGERGGGRAPGGRLR